MSPFNAPDFWWQPKSVQATLLAPIGAVVSWITLRRMARSGTRVPAVVICVGNPTVGGSGKTPTVITLLRRLRERGATPFALLRGYGGTTAGPLLVDAKVHDVRAVGDEAMILAEVAPTIVAHDRVAGARLAISHGATHIVMDDGFQNAGLVKNATLLVVDSVAGIGNGQTIPAGPLRARFKEQLERADALLVVGSGGAQRTLPSSRRRPVFKAHVKAERNAALRLKDQRVLAFAGIGHPFKFFDLLKAIGVEVVEQHSFADHHPYTVAEIRGLLDKAERKGLVPVTTQKDFARLLRPAFEGLRERVHVLPVSMEFEDPAELDDLIHNAEVRSMLVSKPEAAIPPGEPPGADQGTDVPPAPPAQP